jgi:hypothetical protein
LRDRGTLRDDTGGIVSFPEFEAVVDLAGHRELERRYAT